MIYDFCILGAGLAGLTIAEKLSEKYNVVVIDPHGAAAGASGVPIGMVNPANGRYASFTWRGKECYRAVYDTLNRYQTFSETPFFSQSGVIRPAADKEYAVKMKKTFADTDWPEGWCYWLEAAEMQTRFPGLNFTDGAIWMPIDLTVKIPEFLKTMISQLKKMGVSFLFGENYEIEPNGDLWAFRLSDGTSLQARNTITAAGVRSKDIHPWKFLPLHPVKGQIALLATDAPFPYSTTVYISGYSTKYSEHMIAAGSTYEHEFDTPEPTEANYRKILENLSIVLPDINSQIKEKRHWSGIRASTPNRLPILGRHPKMPNAYIFTGFGSKGLLFSSYLSELLFNFIENDTPLPQGVDVNRLHKYFSA